MTLPKDPIKAEQFREKMRLIRTGKKHKPETIDKMISSHSGERNHNYGKKMKEEQKEKIRLTKTGTHQSEETKQKRSEALKKYYEEHPEAKLQKGNHLKKYNDDREYTQEYRLKLSLAKQGENHPNFGKHLPEITREKIRAANSGENCYHYGQSPSEETRQRMSEALKCEKCYNWKGGITELNHAIRTCLQNRDWIQAVFKRDNYSCQKCSATKIYLHAHHIKHFADIMRENNIKTIDDAIACKELWDVNNGKSLCENCHNSEHYGDEEE